MSNVSIRNQVKHFAPTNPTLQFQSKQNEHNQDQSMLNVSKPISSFPPVMKLQQFNSISSLQ